MGMLVDGVWLNEDLSREIETGGRFVRKDSAFRDTITRDGTSGFKAESGRYHLYVAHSCPWAHRTLIYRALKKLEGVITIAAAIPGLREHGWSFKADPAFPDCTPDLVNGFDYLWEAYVATDPRYTGKVTVPALWDRQSGRIVNNESSEIIRMLNDAFDLVTGDKADFYPAHLRTEIDAMNAFVYRAINNGVYRCGFAASQAAYDEAFDELFDALDSLEVRLGQQTYLVGDRQTEADWRLFPTLARFDVAYFSAFKCNKKRVADYPNLARYTKELYNMPGIPGTVKLRDYVINYFSNPRANPNGIVPRGTPNTLFC